MSKFSAKKKAKLDKYTVATYPERASMLEQLMEQVEGTSYADAKLSETFGEYYDMFRSVRQMTTEPGIKAAMPYKLNFNL